MMTSYDGDLGLVIVPDAETARKAVTLGNSVASEYSVSLPHITLHIASVRDVNAKEVDEALADLGEDLRNTPLSLGPLSVFGRKYLFWDLLVSENLRKAHERALALLSPHLSNDAQGAASQPGVVFSEIEKRNIAEYGYPFVRELYRPHITLAFGKDMELPKNIELAADSSRPGSAIEIALVRVGSFGSIANVLASRIL